jgi:hypothetical protein
MDGDYLMAKIVVLNNQQGEKLKSLLKRNLVEFRTSGIGKVQTNSNNIQEVYDYTLEAVHACMINDAAKL